MTQNCGLTDGIVRCPRPAKWAATIRLEVGLLTLRACGLHLNRIAEEFVPRVGQQEDVALERLKA